MIGSWFIITKQYYLGDAVWYATCFAGRCRQVATALDLRSLEQKFQDPLPSRSGARCPVATLRFRRLLFSREKKNRKPIGTHWRCHQLMVQHGSSLEMG